ERRGDQLEDRSADRSLPEGLRADLRGRPAGGRKLGRWRHGGRAGGGRGGGRRRRGRRRPRGQMSSERGGRDHGIPGREAEEMPGFDSSSPSPDSDRNLSPSEAGEGPATPERGADAADPKADSGPSDQGASQVEQDLNSLLADTQRERDEYL